MSVVAVCGIRIGVDFDNTLAAYDALFTTVAGERGWLPPYNNNAPSMTKKAVRTAVRAMNNGEFLWQTLQAEVYGARMGGARLMPGADLFLRQCRQQEIPVAIVSHKTRFARRDPGGVDLRQAARSWMRAQGFFQPDGFGLNETNLFFESTRPEKIARIAHLQCTHFIDDLEEVLADPAFPRQVIRLLFSPGEAPLPTGPFTPCRSWHDIQNHVLGRPHNAPPTEK